MSNDDLIQPVEEKQSVEQSDEGKKAKARTVAKDVRLTEVQLRRINLIATQMGMTQAGVIRLVIDSGLIEQAKNLQVMLSLETSLGVRDKLKRRTSDIQAAISSLEKQHKENPSDDLAASIILLKSAVS